MSTCSRKTTLQCRRFTLTEMTVAIVVLMMIIYMLIRVVSGAQTIWTASRATSEMHETASLALDVISRDLRAMRASDVAGATINYAPDSTGLPTDMKMAFVTSSGLGVDSIADKTLLSEVGYSFSATDSTLYRWRATQSATAEWNFYNNTPANWAAAGSWEDSTVLATGVESVAFTVYSDTDTTMTAASDTYTLPAFVNVAITLVDQRIANTNATNLNRTKLSFTKTIHLNRNE